ncbi:hypothetical protein A3B57_00260 [Microgenomates group bacterium RIFCSPLOWO2_01_FULL_47_10]|nr:MAG: hypothetical protein A3B57_00260 [Microgenomates group bacterium RIFCSPLOWO2_01_FULL_47_10]
MVNTTNVRKPFYSWLFLQSLIRGKHTKDLLDGAGERCAVSSLSHQYEEPRFSKASHASDHKAISVGIRSPEVIASGADSVMHIFDGRRRRWETLHKLEREVLNGATPDLIAREYRRMRDLLVFPGQKRVYLAWDLSATYINGGKHTFSEMLLIDTAPIDQRIFWQSFGLAVGNGKLLTLSPRMPLAEMVFENDPQTKMGFFTSHEMEELGGEAWKKLRPADELMQQLALSAVVTTVPHGIFTIEAMTGVFLKAREISTTD